MKGVMVMSEKQTKQQIVRKYIMPAALVLVVLTVLTAPLVLSKYVVQGTGSAGARVAVWDHNWGTLHIDNGIARTFYRLNDGLTNSATHHRAQSDAIPIHVTNDSEVMVAYTFTLYGYDIDDEEIRDVITPGMSGTPDTNLNQYVTFATTTTTPAGAVTRDTTTPADVYTFFVKPGVAAAFNMKYNANAAFDRTYRCQISVLAEQVD